MATRKYCDVCDRESEYVKKLTIGSRTKDICPDCEDEIFERKRNNVKRRNENSGGVGDLLNNFRNNVTDLMNGKR